MARTKASVGAKVSSGKSSKARCSVAPPSNSSSSSGGIDRAGRSGGGGGNSVCPQPTPKWQKAITNFFISKDKDTGSDDSVGTSTSRPKKRNVIESDDEEVQETSRAPEKSEERPKNSVLDESIELAPLTGEDSHKIEEYYTTNSDQIQNGESQSKNEEKHTDNQENCDDIHKNGENTTKNGLKGKGKGKKTNKENVSSNTNTEVEKRKSVKRDLEEIEENDHVSKKVKVN